MTRRWAGAAVIAGMVGFTLVVYGSLPDRIPTHWNLRGEVDGWSGRFWGAWLMPLIGTGLWLFMPVLRKVDPRRENYERFDRTFLLLVNILVVFLAALHVLALGSALGWAVDFARSLMVMLGLLFVSLGNYLPRVRSNWWMGIRTPWTLESESVWRATHRLAGFTFVGAGIIMLLSALLPRELSFALGFGAALVAATVPVIYSFVVYRRERRTS
jgi:uncharacterized membrane protein